jgi:hypothetical protein
VFSVAREEESIALAAVGDAEASGIEEGYEVKWNKNFFFYRCIVAAGNVRL